MSKDKNNKNDKSQHQDEGMSFDEVTRTAADDEEISEINIADLGSENPEVAPTASSPADAATTTQEVSIAEPEQENLLPFDENQLLELARQEGLDDASSPEEEADVDADLDLPETDQAQIMASIETILFMSNKPVSLPKLRSIINTDDTKISLSTCRKLMTKLREEFSRDHRGIDITEVSMGFQLRTKPHMAAVLRRMVKTQPIKFSPASLEVLSIVAYKQPVTKDELDRIRGVDCGYVLRALMEKRLICIAGRSELPGKPMLYGTTHEFLELFSLKDAAQLPPLHEVESMVAASEVGAEEQDRAAMEHFSKMVATSDRILFDDSKIDNELEALRTEIASIPTSTSFIDEQKAKEKLENRLAELAAEGKTLDMDGNEVAIGSIPELTVEQLLGKQPIPEDVAAILAAVKAAREQALAIEATAAQGALDAAQTAPTMSEYTPSPELAAAAAEAQWERHSAMIAEAVTEAKVADINSEALAAAVEAAKVARANGQLEREEEENASEAPAADL